MATRKVKIVKRHCPLLDKTTERNESKVPRAQWKKWCGVARRVFNATYHAMYFNATLFLHPKVPAFKGAQWKTTAWNAAWVAADATQDALEDIANEG